MIGRVDLTQQFRELALSAPLRHFPDQTELRAPSLGFGFSANILPPGSLPVLCLYTLTSLTDKASLVTLPRHSNPPVSSVAISARKFITGLDLMTADPISEVLDLIQERPLNADTGKRIWRVRVARSVDPRG